MKKQDNEVRDVFYAGMRDGDALEAHVSLMGIAEQICSRSETVPLKYARSNVIWTYLFLLDAIRNGRVG